MNAWQIVLLVVVIVVVLALLAWAATRRRTSARREEQARAHLNEARERQARADSARAAADEKAAQLRRERAELEQRMAQQERESAQLAADAERDHARAAELQERAHRLAPHLAAETSTGTAAGVDAASGEPDGYDRTDAAAPVRYDDRTVPSPHADPGAPSTADGYDAGTVSDYRADPGAPSTADRYDESTVRHADAVDARPPAAEYRHTAPVTDPDGTVDPVVDDHAAGRDARLDSDGDGRPDGSLRERLDGDGTAGGTYADGTYADGTYADGTYADRTYAGDDTAHLDRDGDGVPDDRQRGGLRRLTDRLTGRVDERDGTVEDRDVPDANPRRP